jgi:hypothetical protein
VVTQQVIEQADLDLSSQMRIFHYLAPMETTFTLAAQLPWQIVGLIPMAANSFWFTKIRPFHPITQSGET